MYSVLASFPGPTKERRGPGTHCSRMRGLHGYQVARGHRRGMNGASIRARIRAECNQLGVRYLELKRFANAAIINGESTESVYEVCSIY